ncbi:hypothetical protein IscW_ISCW012918 [Ixodes scapularis]|uniref:Uncharacterized protein n=1 Tax=Ixodes scapularis TaxID=6945 RepID=B7QCA5_IXOSC|nr:hypothetical protein IscW_ISCW012918 [Ixodes scapularis]|eukprot:XP_002413169.1 hypothetical protein IscW_ISCW012918 [Ixodes scapularis]
MPTSSLHLEGEWNGAFQVEEEQGEEFATPASLVWHSGDAEDLFSSHGHLYADQTAFVVVKKEPEDVWPTLTAESVLLDDCGEMSKFPMQLEGLMDTSIAVKEEPGDVPPSSTTESVLPDDYGTTSECPPQLEDHKDCAIEVKEEPADVEWRCSDYEEGSSSSAQERWDQGQQEEQDGPKSNDCRFCPFSSLSKRCTTTTLIRVATKSFGWGGSRDKWCIQ